MQKTILITGSTDGIGLETAKALYSRGRHVVLHGRNPKKLEAAEKALAELSGDGCLESYLADLSHLPEVVALAGAVAEKHGKLDVLINNAGGIPMHWTRVRRKKSYASSTHFWPIG